MADVLSSPFFSELLAYLHHQAVRDLFIETGPIPIERRLFEVFTPREYALKVYRGLPRLYRRDHPVESHVKSNFIHLPSLKRLAVERFLFPLYAEQQIRSGSICLVTWVISDGWGDLIAGQEVLRLFKEKWPELDWKWIALIPKRLSHVPCEALPIYYENECPVALFPQELLHTLRMSDLILSLPTLYPHAVELMQTLRAIPSTTAVPRMICVGQYGYLESSGFHPRSGNHSLGLHFLEKGVLIRKPIHPNFAEIQNAMLLTTLFGTLTPNVQEIEAYLDSHRFYLAYLLNTTGGAIYLHALLKLHARDDQPIDLCTPEIGWFIRHIERQKREEKPFLEGHFRVKEIQVHYEGTIHFIRLADQGKTVRILCPGAIFDADFRLLVRLSGDFIGVRGDQSFSEVVSANRAFFYDGALHARYFIKDLLALAENRLAAYRSTLTIFRGMGKTFLHVLPQEAGEWVDETHFQEREPWVAIAHTMGHALQDPDAHAGFKHFNRIIEEEQSCHAFLHHLIQREMTHRAHPALAQQEAKQLALFAEQECTLVQFIQTMTQRIHSI